MEPITKPQQRKKGQLSTDREIKSSFLMLDLK